MLRWQLKDSATKALVANPQDRTGPATALIEGLGGKLLSYYFALEGYDGVGCLRLPGPNLARSMLDESCCDKGIRSV